MNNSQCLTKFMKGWEMYCSDFLPVLYEDCTLKSPPYLTVYEHRLSSKPSFYIVKVHTVSNMKKLILLPHVGDVYYRLSTHACNP